MYEQIFSIRGDGLEQLARDLVGIGVQKPDPAQFVDLRQSLQQLRQAVLQAEIFAVAGCVLADERDLLYALLRKALAPR